MKKKSTALIAGIVVLALLLVFYLFLHSRDDKEEDQSQEETVTAYETSKDDITFINIKSNGQDYNFVKDGDNWKYSNDTNFPLNSSSFDEIAAKFESIAADRVIENQEDVSEFGLEEPAAVVEVGKNNGETDTLTFGDTNSVTNNSYMTVNEDNSKVYMVASTIVTALQFDINDMAEKEEFPAITSSTITGLIVEKDGSEMSVAKDESSSTGWSYTNWDGTKKDADSSKVSDYLSQVSSLSWSEYVSNNPEDNDKYGLNNPIKITINYQVTEEKEDTSKTENSETEAEEDTSETAETITVDKQEILELGSKTESGDYYAKLQSQSNIYTISSSSVSALIETEPNQFMSSYISNYIFADLDTVTIEKGGNSYEFTKKTEEKEKEDKDNSSEEDNDTETVTTYYMNGKEIELTDFSTFYSKVTVLEAQEWLSELPDNQGQSEMTIHFYKENGLDVTVEFQTYDSNFYFVKDNKGNMALVNKMKVKEMMGAFDEFLEKVNK